MAKGNAEWLTLSGAVSRLWDWDWEGAAVEAKHCLLVARDEHTRDEALNLIACAEWHSRTGKRGSSRSCTMLTSTACGRRIGR